MLFDTAPYGDRGILRNLLNTGAAYPVRVEVTRLHLIEKMFLFSVGCGDERNCFPGHLSESQLGGKRAARGDEFRMLSRGANTFRMIIARHGRGRVPVIE